VRRLLFLAAALPALLVLTAPGSASAAQAGSKAGDAIVVIKGDVTVDRGEAVDGVVIISGDAKISGRVDGDVVLVSGDALVSGRIDGNLVTLSGRARLLPTANVRGDLNYGDEQPVIAPAATVAGSVSKENWTDSLDFAPFVGAIVFWLAVSISSAVLGILLLLIAPRAADAVFERTRERIGPTIAIGVAIAIVLPVTAFLAAITLVGLPLAIGIGLILLPLASVAYVIAAWALGRVILKPPRERILSFLAGLAILRAVALVPILGLLVWLAAVVFGLGLIGAAIGAAREPAEAQNPGS
jgi:cytoskeletal protein CcmA (bactofilin family)